MKRIGIVDYGVGNLRSVANAIDAIGAEGIFIDTADSVEACDAIILPGVGAFEPGMRALLASGMIPALRHYADRRRPLLGICLGMQLLCRRSLENGEHAGLGWIAADVLPFATGGGLKVPHMGWNTLDILKGEHPLVANLPPDSDAYFVHSFYVNCDNQANVIATCNYGLPFAAIIASGSVCGMQFHPEKSQDTGQILLRNFVYNTSLAECL